MKCIFLAVFIVCIVHTTQAQETGSQQLPPVRTSGAVVRTAEVRPIIPLKSGDNARQIKPVQQTVVPIKSGDNVQQPKSLQMTAAPIRKTDAAVVAASAGNGVQNKATKDKPAVILPSSLSLKEAREQSKQ